MRSFIAKLFGKSPFHPLYEHMTKAMECVNLLPDLIEAFIQNDRDKIIDLNSQITRLEHEADEIKNAIRDSIPRGMFFPVNRGDFMAVLKVQDRFPDTVEDIAIQLTLRQTEVPSFLVEPLREFVQKVMETVNQARKIIDRLNALVASSFSGPVCEQTLEMITTIGHLEWEADNAEIKLAKELFKREKEIDVLSIMFLTSIFKNLGSLANHAESIGDRMRIFIAS